MTVTIAMDSENLAEGSDVSNIQSNIQNGGQKHTSEAQTLRTRGATAQESRIFSCKYPTSNKMIAHGNAEYIPFNMIPLDDSSNFNLSNPKSSTAQTNIQSEILHAAWALLLYTYLSNEAIFFATGQWVDEEGANLQNTTTVYHTIINTEKTIEAIFSSSTKNDAKSQNIWDHVNTAVFTQEQVTRRPLIHQIESPTRVLLDQSFQHVSSPVASRTTRKLKH